MKPQQPEITVHLPEDLLRRMLYIAKTEGRTPNNQVILLLRNNTQYFERTHGKIPSEALRAIDITPYLVSGTETEKEKEAESHE
ncbi:putative uncharacterized protein [Clostridium sp. CAG:448]|nr:putative uncharacterized protein [Clostridium sp. CAG:448]